MTPPVLHFEVLSDDYSVSRLAPGVALPGWIAGPGCVSVTWAQDEVSVVCPTGRVPDDVESAAGWVALKVSTKFDFDEPGVVLGAIRPISGAGLGVFVISTFYRDYLLVRADTLAKVMDLLREAGHTVPG